MATPQPGTLISGASHPDDLVPVFLDALGRCDRATYDYFLGRYDVWERDYMLTQLQDALDACSPSGYYFGTRPGTDEDDWGWWPEGHYDYGEDDYMPPGDDADMVIADDDYNANRGDRPPPPPRRGARDSSRRLHRTVREHEHRERSFDPAAPRERYAKPHHFAINDNTLDKRGSGEWSVYFESGGTNHRWYYPTKREAIAVARAEQAQRGGYVTVNRHGIEVFEAGPQPYESNARGIPMHDVAGLTPEQEREAIEHLKSLSLKELRKRQSITQRQITEAYRAQNDPAIRRLIVREQHLITAIDEKEFGSNHGLQSNATMPGERITLPAGHRVGSETLSESAVATITEAKQRPDGTEMLRLAWHDASGHRHHEWITAAELSFTGNASRSSKAMRALADEPEEYDVHAANELQLYIDNDQRFSIDAPDGPGNQGRYLRDSMLRKIKRGKYDHSLAPKGWAYLVEAAAKAYVQEMDSSMTWNRMFDAPTRRHVAQDIADDFRTRAVAGEFDGH